MELSAAACLTGLGWQGLTRELVTSAFEMFDVDGTGSIDVKEFGALLRAMGLVHLPARG